MSEQIPFNRRLPPGDFEGYPDPRGGGGHGDDSFVDGFHVREAFAVVRRNGWIVLLVTILTMLPVLYMIHREPPSYRASAVIRLVDARRALTGGMEDGVASRVLGNKADALLSQLEVLRGREVLGRVVDREGLRLAPSGEGFTLHHLAEVRVAPEAAPDTFVLSFDPEGATVRSAAGEVRAGYGAPVELGGVRFAVASPPAVEEATLVVRSRDAAINALGASLTAAPRSLTDAVDVQYTARDPQTARRVVNTVSEVYQAYNAEMAQQQSRRRRVFLEEQLRATDSLLAQAQEQLSAFRTRETLYSSRDKIVAEQQGLMELDIRREEMRADQQMFQSLLATLRNRRGGERSDALRTLLSSPGMAENPVIGRLYGQLTQYEAERASLTAGTMAMTAEHPDVVRLDRLISSTQNNLVDAVRSHIASLEARVAALDRLRARNSSEIQDLPRTGVEEDRLVQETESVRRISDQLREELQKARMAEAVEAGQVEIVNLAPLPTGPVDSGRGWKIGLGLVLGLMLGVGGAFAREAANTSIRRRGEIRKVLHLPDLATIPQVGGHSRLGGRIRLPQRKRPAARLLPGGDDLPLVTAAEVASSGAEAYRTLRTNLLFSRVGERFRSVVVTSAGAGEGKSTIAANLAVAFAKQGKRVLLVDCDLRRPRLHEFFQMDREPGLTHLLSGTEPVAEVVRRTPVEGLFVVTCGTPPENPAEMLGSGAMRGLLEHAESRFDLVVLDTPPVLAASDSSVLGTLVDGVVLVVRAGHTAREAARDALRQLSAVGANVVGAVLNDPDAVVPAYESYYHDYYYQYYGEAKR